MNTVHPSPLLRFALAIDAIATGTIAACQLAAPDALSDLFQLPRAVLVETGIFFVAYTMLLAVLASRPKLWSGLVGFIAAGNLAWGAACVMVLMAGVLTPSPLGVGFVLFQAAAVVLFAVLQLRGLKTSAPALAATASARA